MTTIREVSKLANVSVATVSRVVNGNKWVSDKTRDKVLAAMSELGYQPNSFARSLATNKSETFGMVVGDLGGPFFGDMMNSAEDAIRKAGKHLIVTSGHDSVDSERGAIDFLLQRRVDGLLLHLDVLPDDDIISLSDRCGVPIVLVNRHIPELSNQCVFVDNDLGGYLATKHLIELGHSEIACITGPMYKKDARNRLAGYRSALEEAGLQYSDNLVIESDYTELGGKAAIDKLTRRNAPYTAVFAHNDHMAIGAMTSLKALGKSVPEHCSIVGYDDMVMARYVEPALTTVAIPVGEFGKQAAFLALKLSGEQNNQINHQFDPKLVIRRSTAPLKPA
ncbi:LacI family DNA-binding transcriptional regulator [Reinekea marina]|uniref:LacI family DNA-binding transcriptional regulator n=1 Tax=Reinekea marina TaxID=1310421 RepID=A0ABV7WR63_9GAMM|nr:LacI family DNA-binding transcriptional regulator [Reinekea marina]MDN3648039.1 LacI family DNA-binding transcriptional regulator [Reinekea marina]